MKMPKIMDTHDSLTLEQEYKGTVGVCSKRLTK